PVWPTPRAPVPAPTPVATPAHASAPVNAAVEQHGPLPRPRLPRPFQSGVLSYTALAELERCGYRHYLERVLRLAETDPAGRRRGRSGTGGLRARILGEVAHSLLERLDFTRAERPSDARIAEVAHGRFALELDDAETAVVARLLDGVCSAPLAARIAAARELRREAPFAFSIGSGEPTIVGVFDLIASERPGAELIVDYKSGSVGDGTDLDALVDIRFGAQRLLYALASLHAGAREVEVVHWFLERPLAPVAARFGADDLGRLQSELLARLAVVRTRGYAVSDTPHRGLCLTCPGRSTELCSWSEEAMLRDIDDAAARKEWDRSQ
ncbi:MAG: PD-(D/E)XK nuclease family protein, partial [Solirubrobacteraceae bacterium]